MKKLTFLILTIAAVSLTSCSKDNDTNPAGDCWECYGQRITSIVQVNGDVTRTTVNGNPYELCDYSQADIDNHIAAKTSLGGTPYHTIYRTAKCVRK